MIPSIFSTSASAIVPRFNKRSIYTCMPFSSAKNFFSEICRSRYPPSACMVSFICSMRPTSSRSSERQNISRKILSSAKNSLAPSAWKIPSSSLWHTESRRIKRVGTFLLSIFSPPNIASAMRSAFSPSTAPSARTDAIGGFALAAATTSSNPTTEISLPGWMPLRFNSSYSPSAVSSLTQKIASRSGSRSRKPETISRFFLVSVPSTKTFSSCGSPYSRSTSKKVCFRSSASRFVLFPPIIPIFLHPTLLIRYSSAWRTPAQLS